jgi:thiol:disulfide interchange protein
MAQKSSPLTYEKAVALSREDNKLIFVRFTATWCGPCRQMQKTYEDAEVKKILSKLRVVVVDVDTDAETVTLFRKKTVEAYTSFKFKSIPSYYVVDAKTYKPTRWGSGYRDKEAFLLWLKENR